MNLSQGFVSDCIPCSQNLLTAYEHRLLHCLLVSSVTQSTSYQSTPPLSLADFGAQSEIRMARVHLSPRKYKDTNVNAEQTFRSF